MRAAFPLSPVVIAIALVVSFSISYSAFFWSATEYVNTIAWLRSLSYFNGSVIRNNYFKSVGASDRCLRD